MIELFYLLIIIGFFVYFYKHKKEDLPKVKDNFLGAMKRYLLYVLSIVMIASIIQGVVPTEVITGLLGEQNGFLAPVIAAVVASVFEGPTIVAFVIAASLLESGVSLSAAIAFISAFSMLGIYSIPLEQAELGKKLPLIRFGTTFIFCLVIGVASEMIFKLL